MNVERLKPAHLPASEVMNDVGPTQDQPSQASTFNSTGNTQQESSNVSG